MHAADYDLTGQILWPAARLLAGYLAANRTILEGCSCACELGAGLGLVGLLAAQKCPVILTDHNEVVLRVLSRNAELSQAQQRIRQVSSSGSHEAIMKLRQNPVLHAFDYCMYWNVLPLQRDVNAGA